MEAVLFREVCSYDEVLDLLRLRHSIYFEKHQYGDPRPHGVDITPHDHLSKLYGVFRGKELVGGVRFVFRHETPVATVIQEIQADVQDYTTRTYRGLPSERAFDVRGTGSEDRIDVELGRFVLTSGQENWVSSQVLISVLAVCLLERVRLYLYACSTKIAPRYARYMAPTWTLTESQAEGLDGFAFPLKTIAAIGAPDDSAYLLAAQSAADELRTQGFITLPNRHPKEGR
jgi:hypothetical protein